MAIIINIVLWDITVNKGRICMNNKGFTLLELLAVVVILAAIAIITTPIIYDLINSSREKAFVDTGYGLVSAARTYQTKAAGNNESLELQIDYKNSDKTVINKLDIRGKLPDSGVFRIDANGKTELKLWSDRAKICITKTKESKSIKIDRTITKANCTL